MLIIKNIDRAVGTLCDGHVIESAGEVLAAGIPRYVFRFAHMPHYTNVSMGSCVEIMLEKVPKSNGKYQLFAMGWQRATYIHIDEHEIAQLHLLAFQIGCVLKKLKTYLLSTREHMKTLIILRGLPGSGKSSFAKYMFSNNVFEADQYFYDSNGNYNFDASKLHEAHLDCQKRVEELMQMSETTQYGQEIVVSNTATTERELEPYLKLAKSYGYIVVSLIVENRHGNKSVHGVPDETLEKMRKRFSVKL